MFTGIHHLALIAVDLDATVRFWRDLLGMPLSITAGDAGSKHYFFQVSPNDAVAFFWWPGTTAIDEKAPGVPTRRARGFDHVAIGVASRSDLYALFDRLTAAGASIVGPVDHGLTLSIYATDPNGVSVELAWQSVDVLQPLLFDATPGAAAAEGASPRPDRWPSRPIDGLRPVTIDPQAALLRQAEARGLVRARTPSPETDVDGKVPR